MPSASVSGACLSRTRRRRDELLPHICDRGGMIKVFGPAPYSLASLALEGIEAYRARKRGEDDESTPSTISLRHFLGKIYGVIVGLMWLSGNIFSPRHRL